MHGVIGSRFGGIAARVAALASILGFSVLIGWESVVGATLLRQVLKTDNVFLTFAPILLVAIAAAYTAVGGLRVNARLNAGQNILKSVLLVIAAAVLILNAPTGISSLTGPQAMKSLGEAVTVLGGIGLIANLAFSFFWQPVDMLVWQNVAAADSREGGQRRALIWAAILVFFFPGFIGSLIGISLTSYSHLGEITDASILTKFVEALSEYTWFGLFLFVAYIAAMLSTIDGYALAAAQSTTWDLLQREKVTKLLALGAGRTAESDDSEVVAYSRIAILFLGLFGSFLVMWMVFERGISIFDIVYFVVVAQMSLVGPVWLCLTGDRVASLKKGPWPIILALIAGVGAVLVGGVWKQSQNVYTFAPLITIFVSLLTAVLVSRKPNDVV